MTSSQEKQLLVDVKTVGEMLGCSMRQVYRMSDSGQMPRPIKLGGANRWRREELLTWIEQGCPRMGTKLKTK